MQSPHADPTAPPSRLAGRDAPARRRSFRAFPLDGAMLYFQPATGTHVRVATEATLAARRRAPRVAMFGITNACNLSCSFCSRDTRRPSAWTVESAANALRGLARAGTLEVAFGGGEPFAFRGFAELVAELFATTELALNVTANGTLLRNETWAAFAGRFGQVRVSIYDEVDWLGGCRVLAEHGQRFGANVLVDEPALERLPARLAELAAIGCRDVSLLSYVGPDAARHLDGSGRARLASIVDDSPLPCRLSVCFGDRVPVTRLFDGCDGTRDCGAGLDFVSITPDQRVQGCSFHDGGLPGATAEQILEAWSQRRLELTRPSLRDGCARRLPFEPAPSGAPQLPPVAVWRAFSGNNSGECILVAKFTSVADAEAYLAELLPGLPPEGIRISDAWRRLFVAEGVAAPALAVGEEGDVRGWADSSRQIVTIGPSLLALSYDSDDAFAELRALAWKRGAHVVPGGIHVHDAPALLVAVRGRDAADARALASRTPHPTARVFLHGEIVLATLPLRGSPESVQDLEVARGLVLGFAADRRCSAEILEHAVDDAALVAVAQRLGRPLATRPRLVATFHGGDGAAKAQDFARMLADPRATVAGSCVLVDDVARRKRIAVLAHRRDAVVTAVDGTEVRVRGYLWREPPPRTKGKRVEPGTLDPAPVEAALVARLPRAGIEVGPAQSHFHTLPVGITTDAPADALAALADLGASLACRLHLSIEDVDPLAFAVRRLLADVGIG